MKEENIAIRMGYIGGADRNRTDDLCSAIAALSQLSYGPEDDGSEFRVITAERRALIVADGNHVKLTTRQSRRIG